jgi:hypothetical protein
LEVFLSKQNYEVVEFLVKTTNASRVPMANGLIQRGMQSFYGEGEEFQSDNEAKERSELLKVSRFIGEMGTLARSKAWDFSKII